METKTLSILAMTNLLLILLLGCSSLLSSTHINFTKVNTGYFNIGVTDYCVLMRFKNYAECGFLLSKFTKSDKHIFDMGLEYGRGGYFDNSSNVSRQRAMLNIHTFKKLF